MSERIDGPGDEKLAEQLSLETYENLTLEEQKALADNWHTPSEAQQAAGGTYAIGETPEEFPDT